MVAAATPASSASVKYPTGMKIKAASPAVKPVLPVKVTPSTIAPDKKTEPVAVVTDTEEEVNKNPVPSTAEEKAVSEEEKENNDVAVTPDKEISNETENKDE